MFQKYFIKDKSIFFRGSFLVIAPFIAIFVGVTFYYVFSRFSTSPIEKINSEVINFRQDEEGPDKNIEKPPFFEMTIPGMRERTFDGKVLSMPFRSDAGSYKSYFATYDSDGLKINGQLTVPEGEAPEGGWPAVVFVHGYIPPTIYSTFGNYESYVDYLAKRGLVVFKIDLRGHDESEGVPHGGYYSEGYVVDVLNAYSALQKLDYVNSEKIGLWGHSMSGNVTFRSFVVNKNIPKLVIWAGAVYTYDDLQKYQIDDNSYRPPTDNSERQKRREDLANEHGNFNKESEFWRQVVPVNYLDGVIGEVQIHHAVDDSVVNIGYSRDLVPILNSASIANELFEYSSGGHNLTGSSFNQAMQRTAEFLTSY